MKLRERLSSTLCGVGSAVSRRVLRGQDAKLIKDVAGDYPWLRDLIVLTSVSAEVNAALDRGRKVLIEGTQGFGLSVYHSEFYPHCTSRDTTAAGVLAEVGISPRMVTEIVLVFRTFPIRVAGVQAGPLGKEITWDQIRKESECPFEIEERTSVTNRIRRVARFDWELAKSAATVNRPTRLAINGLDYLNYRNRGIDRIESLTPQAKAFVQQLETMCSSGVSYLGTGPRLDQILLTNDVSYEKCRTKLAS